jgi:molecular chaperone GrpE
MAEKDSENPSGLSYELDLDDTISAWDQVVEEAVAAVERKDDVRSIRDVKEDAGGSESTVPAAEEREATPETAGEEAPGEATPGEAAPGEAAPGEEARVAGEGGAREDDTEVRNLRDRLIRTLADFDNFRKRTEREKSSIKRFALFDVLRDFLSVHDNLERALAASGNAEDLKTGVEMTARQFTDLLLRHGVEPVPAVGRVFDPTVHEAVSREEGADVVEPTVTAELQRGYRLHDRLLRPALVIVAMPPPQPPEEEVSSEESDDDAVFEIEAGDEPEDSPEDREEKDEAPGESFARATEVS